MTVPLSSARADGATLCGGSPSPLRQPDRSEPARPFQTRDPELGGVQTVQWDVMRGRTVALFLWWLPAFVPESLPAATPALLQEAVDHWVEGKEEIALTQRTRILNDDGTIKGERLERYDPSLPDERRWHLLEVDGKAPTDDQRRDIEYRKNRKARKHANKPPADLLDLPHATVRDETPQVVTYAVAVRPEAARLVQTEKLILLITVGRKSRAIERITASLRDQMRVALGLVRVTDIDFDFALGAAAPPEQKSPSAAEDKVAAGDRLTGTGRVALSKLGERMEFEWSDFKRVDAYQAAPRKAGMGPPPAASSPDRPRQ